MSPPRISAKEREELLHEANQRCFFFDVGDAGALLCRANMPFGIAKIHWVQRMLGYEPDARYISTPDSTVTRNRDRWLSGFGYGGAIDWSGDFVPIELKPNCCGMLALGLVDIPPAAELGDVVKRLMTEPLDVGGPVEGSWDIDVGNHFLNLYEVSEPALVKGYRYVAIMHSSGKELRRASELGPGLYLTHGTSKGSLRDISERCETPFGAVRYARGEAARTFREYAAMAERYARRRRAAYADEIFGGRGEILFNQTHQGLTGDGRMVLGCYDLKNHDVPWVPVTLRQDLPAYLVAPSTIYSRETLERERMIERARESGCLPQLLDAGILPHGGGYTYPATDEGPVEVDDRGLDAPRRFRMGQGTEWFESIRELPFAYRGEEVVRRIEELGCGRIVARLDLVRALTGS